MSISECGRSKRYFIIRNPIVPMWGSSKKFRLHSSVADYIFNEPIQKFNLIWGEKLVRRKVALCRHNEIPYVLTLFSTAHHWEILRKYLGWSFGIPSVYEIDRDGVYRHSFLFEDQSSWAAHSPQRRRDARFKNNQELRGVAKLTPEIAALFSFFTPSDPPSIVTFCPPLSRLLTFSFSPADGGWGDHALLPLVGRAPSAFG